MLTGRFQRLGESTMRVELNRDALFALASDTRLEILRSLQPMRRTVTQLASSLGIDKAAVFRHLKTLEAGGLVRRYEDHGFVYYGLSWKARDMLSPGENTRVIITLSFYWFALAAAVAVCWIMLQGEFNDALDPSRRSDPSYDPARSLLAILSFLAAACIALLAGILAWLKVVRAPKQPLGGDDDDDAPGMREAC